MTNAYKITKNVRHGKKTTYYVDFEDGRMFRILHWCRDHWQIEEWDFQAGRYEFSGKKNTAAEALKAIIDENSVTA